ncbi:MAG: glutamate-5-semialdehyde dehydrogenase [Eubacterium sp.]|jgi:glutamate-5-semialdehyde dehydrogenase|nr:glutamate-5-semialdehyde dehydrogenase [Eubacterium sp.]
MEYLKRLGSRAKEAEEAMRSIKSVDKNKALKILSGNLLSNSKNIISANQKDVENAKRNNMTEAFIDRLTITEKRISEMSSGVLEVAALPDPVGEIIGGGELYNGITITKKRVPLGVIGIIFESRPNVTIDASALCLKSGNVCILRGGSDAINSNIYLTSLIQDSLEMSGLPRNAVQLVEDTSRETAKALMKLNEYVDVLIPRGGAGLIRSVVENASIPIIKTGEGVCHLYVDKHADINMAVRIADNAKTQRPSVCNAIETILVNVDIAKDFWSKIGEIWKNKVIIYGDQETAEYVKVERIASNEDYAAEFNDNIIAAKTVCNVSEAVRHISRFGTKHSECIITEDLKSAEYFLKMVDAAAVYVNASTRFTDGQQFGLGAEIGISNQKLHARGPMGLSELTTYKYLIRGNGQIRN